MKKALSIYQVLNGKHRTFNFSGEWQDVFGSPATSGTWLIWGQSFNGKTSFVLQLAKYLCSFEKVVIDSLEEGVGESMKMALVRNKMEEVARKVILLDGLTIPDLITYLGAHKSPNIVIVDSLQYADLTYKDYKSLKQQFPNKLFIFVSHAEGKLPDGRLANKIRYDAMCKIRIEGYRAFVNSRFKDGSGENYISIWDEGANRYWGDKE